MKKITQLLLFCSIALTSNAQNWGLFDASRSSITINGINYTLWNSGTGTFHNTNLGAFTTSSTLLLTYLKVNTWKSSGGDVTGGNYYYTIYVTGNRPANPQFTALPLSWESNSGNNNQAWSYSGSIDLINGLSTGSYSLEIYGNITGTGSQTNLYDSTGSLNYYATFTVTTTTNTEQRKSSISISSTSGIVNASFAGKAKVELSSLSGKLIFSDTVENQFSKAVKSGIYILKINEQAHKVVVK